MIAADLRPVCFDIFGPSNDGPHIFRKLTGAVELISRKGNWNALLAYGTAQVDSQGRVFLPGDVENLLRVNDATGKPIQVRDQYFAYDVNQPGEDGASLGFTFEQRFTTPLQAALTVPTRLKASAGSPAIRVTGIDSVTGQRVESMTLQTIYGDCPLFSEIIHVSKDEGVANSYVDLICETAQDSVAAGGRLARYHWRDTTPEFRMVQIAGPGTLPTSVRVLYRRRSYAIKSWLDYIPLSSELAIEYALRALKEYETGNMAGGDGYQAKALEFLSDEQTARTDAGASAQGSTASLSNYSGRFAGILTAGELYDDAAAMLGAVGRERILDAITEAVDEIQKAATWDAQVGYADLYKPAYTLGGPAIFALPSWVDAVLAVRVQGAPAIARSRWIDFNVSGGWNDERTNTPMMVFDHFDASPLIYPLPTTSTQLIAICETSGDVGKLVRVEGLDSTGRQQRADYPAILDPATALPAGYPTTFWSRIDRMHVPPTMGFVRVHVLGVSPLTGQFLSEARPSESEFWFQRIRVNSDTTRVSIAFRRRTERADSLDSLFFVRSRQAVLAMMRAQQLRATDVAASEAQKAVAIRLLEEEQASRQPGVMVNYQSTDELSWSQRFID